MIFSSTLHALCWYQWYYHNACNKCPRLPQVLRKVLQMSKTWARSWACVANNVSRTNAITIYIYPKSISISHSASLTFGGRARVHGQSPPSARRGRSWGPGTCGSVSRAAHCTCRTNTMHECLLVTPVWIRQSIPTAPAGSCAAMIPSS